MRELTDVTPIWAWLCGKTELSQTQRASQMGGNGTPPESAPGGLEWTGAAWS